MRHGLSCRQALKLADMPLSERTAYRALRVMRTRGEEGLTDGRQGHPYKLTTSYLGWHTGLVASYIGHLISLVTDGVFVKHPRLRWVLIEGGVSRLPPLLWRLDKNYKLLRQTVPWLTRPPSKIVREHVLLTTQPLEEPEDPSHLRQVLGMFDAGRMLMFSSDYPHWDGDTPDFAGRAIPPAMRDRVMGDTARELYCLPRQHTGGGGADAERKSAHG